MAMAVHQEMISARLEIWAKTDAGRSFWMLIPEDVGVLTWRPVRNNLTCHSSMIRWQSCCIYTSVECNGTHLGILQNLLGSHVNQSHIDSHLDSPLWTIGRKEHIFPSTVRSANANVSGGVGSVGHGYGYEFPCYILLFEHGLLRISGFSGAYSATYRCLTL